MQQLLEMLDEEVSLLQALVQCTQTEQQHLLAFEPEPLDSLLVHKNALIDRVNERRLLREQVVVEQLAELRAKGESLTDLVSALHSRQGGARFSAPVAARRDTLKALLSALAELTAVSALHARRQVHWARTSRRRLARHDEQPSYDRSGRSDALYGTTGRLNASV
jgi:hypothetical protein